MYCKRCGARVQQGIPTCPECGARQSVRVNAIRCANCHGRAPADLTVCPHCGRDLHPAGPRWGLLLGGAALLALAFLWGLGRLPVDEVRRTALDARDNAQGLVQILGAVAPATLADDLAPLVEPATPQIIAAAPATATPTPTATPTATEPAITEAITNTVPLIEAPAEVITATVTLEPTPTADDSAAYTVRSGDTLMSIGARLGIAWEEIARANGLNASSTLKIGQKLRLPEPTATPTVTLTPTATLEPTPTETPTATPSPTAAASPTATRRANSAATPTQPPPTPTQPPPAPTATARPSSGTTTYRVQSGDSLSSIGARFGIPWESIAAANRISPSTTLRIGQELIIPLSGTVPPTATPTRRPTATATAPSAPTQAPPTPQPWLPAPVLRDPSDQTPIHGDKTMIFLTWQPIPGMPPDAQYQVTIRWTQGGVLQETLTEPTPATEQRFPPWLWSLADQPDRKYTWFVTAIRTGTDGKGGITRIPVSASSPARTLTWN